MADPEDDRSEAQESPPMESEEPVWRRVVYWSGAVLALFLVFLVIAMAFGTIGTGPYPLGTWVGIVTFLLLVILVVLLIVAYLDPRVREPPARDEEPAPELEPKEVPPTAAEVVAAGTDEEAEEPAPAPVVDARPPTGEGRVADEVVDGLRVVEYSRPPKDATENLVYTRTEIPLDGSTLLRLEEAVARRR